MEDASFGKVPLDGCNDVCDLAERASLLFEWGVKPTQVALFPVPPACARDAERDHSSAEGILRGPSLFSGDLLADAGVVPGSYLLARTTPPAPPGGACVRSLALHRAPSRPPPPHPRAYAGGGWSPVAAAAPADGASADGASADGSGAWWRLCWCRGLSVCPSHPCFPPLHPAVPPISPRSHDSSIVSGLIQERSDSAEALASVAMLRFVHDAFPFASLYDCRDKLLDPATMLIANRVFKSSAPGFSAGLSAFATATLKAPRPTGNGVLKTRDCINFEGSYSSIDCKELEFDCIVKLPVYEGCEWTRDEATGLFLIAASSAQLLPSRPAPPLSPAWLPASSRSTSFSTDCYPPNASMYVVAEVYAPLTEEGSKMPQKLLQAERLLQFLKAKEHKEHVRECVLGFVFVGPKMDTAAGAKVAKLLSFYSSVLPCLSELQQHRRLLGFQTSFHPAVAEFHTSVAVAELGEKQEQLGEKQEQLGEKQEQLGGKQEQLGKQMEEIKQMLLQRQAAERRCAIQ